MKTVLVFGGGKSSGYLIEYLLTEAVVQDWQVRVVDINKEAVQRNLQGAKRGVSIVMDIQNEEARGNEIEHADIVISLVPPSLHQLIAKDCLRFKKACSLLLMSMNLSKSEA